MKMTLVAVFLLLTSTGVNAQLSTVIGKNSNAPDDFVFVALTEIANGTDIYITNRAWDNTLGNFVVDGEGVILFTATSTIPKGTVSLITPTDPSNFTVASDSGGGLGAGLGNAGLVGATTWSPTSSDPFYMFRSDVPGADPGVNVDEIYGLLSTLTPAEVVANPQLNPATGTNHSPNAVVFFFQSDPRESGIDFNGNRSTATPADLENQANYLDLNAPDTFLILNTTFFSSTGLPVELESFSIE